MKPDEQTFESMVKYPHALVSAVSFIPHVTAIKQTVYVIIVRKYDYLKENKTLKFLDECSITQSQCEVCEIEVPKSVIAKLDFGDYKPVLVMNEGTVYEQKSVSFRNYILQNKPKNPIKHENSIRKNPYEVFQRRIQYR